MADYDNTNTGALFKSRDKKSDKHPDYTGKLNVGGVEYWLSGWIKEGKSGKFFSLKVKQKEAAADWVDVGPGKAAVKRDDPISTGRMPARQNILPDDQDIPF